MTADYHIHTPRCGHAEGAMADFAQAAQTRTLSEMAFADHAPAPDGYDAACRMALDEFPSYCHDVQALNTPSDLPVLLGIEADYYDGCEHFLADWLPRQPFDLVIGSIHYLGSWGFDNPVNLAVWKTANVEGTWREYFRQLERLADTRLYDIVGHLDLPKKFGHRVPDDAVRDMATPALDRIAAAGMAIEINTSGLRKPVGEIYPSPLLLALARERDIPITFGSDSHRPDEVGRADDQAVALARAAGYTHAVRFSQRHMTPVLLG